MKLYIDTANIEQIKEMIDYFPVSGITTNPTILSREKTNPFEQLKRINDILENNMQFHVQVISDNASDIVNEAIHIKRVLGEQIYIKIPVSDEGIKAMKELSKNGINVTATAIYTPMQALVAAMSGAKYVAPYVNRLSMVGQDGVSIALQIQSLLDKYNLDTQLLAASFKNVEQIFKIALGGGECVTVSPDLLKQLIKHPLTDKAIYDFKEDFIKVSSPNSTMFDL